MSIIILLLILGATLTIARFYLFVPIEKDVGKTNRHASKPMIVDKPWGHEEIWAKTDNYVGKLLCINKGHKLSTQYHVIKPKAIMVLKGEMLLEIGYKAGGDNDCFSIHMYPGDIYHINPYVVHKMIGIIDVTVVEVSTPELKDVVRLEDDYGRIGD